MVAFGAWVGKLLLLFCGVVGKGMEGNGSWEEVLGSWRWEILGWGWGRGKGEIDGLVIPEVGRGEWKVFIGMGV